MLSPVEKLSAIEEIRLLKAEYLRCVDSHDFAGYRSLLTDDCVFCPQNAPDPNGAATWPGAVPYGWWRFRRVEGAEAIAGMLKQSHVGITSLHRAFMPEIEIVSAEEARGIWGIEDVVRWPSGRSAHGFGYYRDHYVRQNGAWRFKSIAVTRTALDVKTSHAEVIHLPVTPRAARELSPATLLAIEEIKAFKARYFRSLDGHDWPAYRSLLTDDCVFCPANTPESKAMTDPWPGTIPRELWHTARVDGADAIVNWIAAAFVGANSLHRGHMPEIDIVSDDEARGIWGMEDTVRWPGRTLHGYGHYRDHYVRQNGMWRVKSMELIRTSVEWSNHHSEVVRV